MVSAPQSFESWCEYLFRVIVSSASRSHFLRLGRPNQSCPLLPSAICCRSISMRRHNQRRHPFMPFFLDRGNSTCHSSSINPSPFCHTTFSGSSVRGIRCRIEVLIQSEIASIEHACCPAYTQPSLISHYSKCEANTFSQTLGVWFRIDTFVHSRGGSGGRRRWNPRGR